MISITKEGTIASNINLNSVCEEGTIIAVIEPDGMRHRFRIYRDQIVHMESHSNVIENRNSFLALRG